MAMLGGTAENLAFQLANCGVTAVPQVQRFGFSMEPSNILLYLHHFLPGTEPSCCDRCFSSPPPPPAVLPAQPYPGVPNLPDVARSSTRHVVTLPPSGSFGANRRSTEAFRRPCS